MKTFSLTVSFALAIFLVTHAFAEEGKFIGYDERGWAVYEMSDGRKHTSQISVTTVPTGSDRTRVRRYWWNPVTESTQVEDQQVIHTIIGAPGWNKNSKP